MMAKEIARELSKRSEDIARYLLPSGKKVGNEFCIGNITGETGASLKICLSGEKAGIWSDFATGDSGDLLNLWSLKRNISLQEAMKEARQYLGISLPKFEGYRTPRFSRPSPENLGNLQATSPVIAYLVNERKLTPETITAYKIGTKTGAIAFPYWRDSSLIQIKYIRIERDEKGKKISWTEKDCEPCLFGWHLIPSNARTLTICEGEIDAMTLYQYGFCALSVPFGGGAGGKHKWLEHEFDRLAPYDEIYLCFDNDEKGKLAAIEITERLGAHRCRIVKLPKKDANECLKAGITKDEIQECYDSAQALDPEELKSAHLFLNDVINEFYPSEGTIIGYNPPWEKSKGKIIFRPSELSVWTGINGHGKSQFLGHIILQAMKEGARVCFASMELKPKKLLWRLTRQAAGIKEPTENYIKAIHDWYMDKLWLFDLVGTAKTERLLEVFLYARQRYDVDVFVIDSLMKLDIDEEDYSKQKLFIGQLCDFKNQYNCHIHIIAHPKKAKDETIPPGKLDTRGAGAVTDLADNCFGVWRNKKKEDAQRLKEQRQILSPSQIELLENPDCLWMCDKQRNGDWEGRIGLWFDNASFQYLNHATQRPTQFVDFSLLA